MYFYQVLTRPGDGVWKVNYLELLRPLKMVGVVVSLALMPRLP